MVSAAYPAATHIACGSFSDPDPLGRFGGKGDSCLIVKHRFGGAFARAPYASSLGFRFSSRSSAEPRLSLLILLWPEASPPGRRLPYSRTVRRTRSSSPADRA